jgi:hypothetical protein
MKLADDSIGGHSRCLQIDPLAQGREKAQDQGAGVMLGCHALRLSALPVKRICVVTLTPSNVMQNKNLHEAQAGVS